MAKWKHEKNNDQQVMKMKHPKYELSDAVDFSSPLDNVHLVCGQRDIAWQLQLAGGNPMKCHKHYNREKMHIELKAFFKRDQRTNQQ